MSQLGPYASYNAETGYAVQISPTSEYVGIFERINIQKNDFNTLRPTSNSALRISSLSRSHNQKHIIET